MVQKQLNMQMIDRAMKTTSFDLRASDFTTSKYQEEIRYLFTLGYFPNFDVKNTVKTVTVAALNKSIRILKQEDSQKFKSMYQYKLPGVGPGEVVMFFLIDDAYLGGGLASAVDLFVKDKKYEIKAASISNTGFAYNFRLGGNVSLTKIMSSLNELRVKHSLGGSSGEMSGAIIDAMRKKAPVDFDMIEKEYCKLAEKYFSGHQVMFINNSTSNTKMGYIESIQDVKASDITIERVTGGTVKPRVKLKR